MIVRRELSSDIDAVRDLLDTASLQAIVDELRRSDVWLQALSFVALETTGDVVGYVVGTRGRVGSSPALALGPPTIHPQLRGRGVGQALMHTILGAADALGETIAGLVADPAAYFLRFGFAPGDAYGVAAPVPEWEPYFLVRPLTAYTPALRGTFVFPEPFTRR